MGWIKEKNENKKVKGVIVAGNFDEGLYYAQLTQNNIDVYLYELDIKLKEFKKHQGFIKSFLTYSVIIKLN